MPSKNDMFIDLFSYKELIKMMLKLNRSIEKTIENRRDLAFRPYFFKTAGKSNKPLASVDLDAELIMSNLLMNRIGKDKVFVTGEESITGKIDLSKESNKIIALMDMIDGTDLLERGFSNWCSAITFYQVNNKEVKILGAVIAVRGGYIYYATADRDGAYKRLLSETLGDQEFALAGPSKSRELNDASICMYAQKSKNLLELLKLNKKKKFIHWLNEIGEIEKQNRDIGNSESIKFRFYNFAGNPMMAKLGDGIVDIVFDLKGQAPHDVVPGAFIAMKVNAVLGKINGEKFTIKELSDYLLLPNKTPLRYILAANESVLKKFSDLLK